MIPSHYFDICTHTSVRPLPLYTSTTPLCRFTNPAVVVSHILDFHHFPLGFIHSLDLRCTYFAFHIVVNLSSHFYSVDYDSFLSFLDIDQLVRLNLNQFLFDLTSSSTIRALNFRRVTRFDLTQPLSLFLDVSSHIHTFQPPLRSLPLFVSYLFSSQYLISIDLYVLDDVLFVADWSSPSKVYQS